MAGQRSLVNIFWTSMTLIYLSLVCLLVYLWLGDELRNRKSEFDHTRQTYIAAQKQKIQTRVNQAVQYIEHQKSLAGIRVRKEVESRTREAYQTISHIHEKNRDRLSLEDIKERIHDALFAASWDDGKGYYFVEDMEGTEIVNRNNPELEGTNILNLKDSKGKYIVKDILAIAGSPAGEGFSTYHWNKPNAPGVLVPKISHVKYFPPLNWVVGNGKYLADEEEKIKDEVIDYIQKLEYGDNNYLFAGTFTGASLSGPLKEKNTLNITDINGVKIVQDLITVAKSGGGFVSYVAPEFKDLPPIAKISYAKAIFDWEWYIGTGVPIDAIETLIQQKQARIQKSIRILMIKSAAALCLFLMVSFFMAWLLSRKIKNNIDLFLGFFSRSAAWSQPIANDQISFIEFQSLAVSANKMIKKRKESETALKKSEEKYRRLFEKSKDAILLIENEVFVDCNQATVEMLGYTDKKELLHSSPSELSPEKQPDGKDSHLKAKEMIALAAKNGSHRFEWNHLKANGVVFPVEVLLTLISSDRGKNLLHTTWRDITDRKKAEILMIRSEKMMTVGGLAAGMAHEINNPLAGMMQNAQVIKNRLTKTIPANDKAASAIGISLSDIQAYMEMRGIPKMLESITETGNHAARIVRNMLNFTRKKTSEKAFYNLSLLLDKSIELIQNDYNLKKKYGIDQVKIIKEYDRDQPPVLCDDTNLQQVFFNLLKNAAHAMFDAPQKKGLSQITLRLSSDKKFAKVEIQDNGPGMDKAISNRIFEPFFTTKKAKRGTGLGLSVSYFIIVDDHGGKLDMESTPGQGAKFIIRLPLSVPLEKHPGQ
jgi:two-component system NtrC family sensor kinase